VYWTNADNTIPFGFDNNDALDVLLFDRQTDTTKVITFPAPNTAFTWNGASYPADISADGSVVVFESEASNGVANDTNGVSDVFSYDVATNQITRVSVSNAEQQANGQSADPTVSANGDIIAFSSDATNLVSAADTNAASDVFLRFLNSSTIRISTDANGGQLNGGSASAMLSASGGRVAFLSNATNVVPGVDTNGTINDVYVKEWLTDNAWRASIDANDLQSFDGVSLEGIDSAGNRILFANDRSSQPPSFLWIRDLERSRTDLASRTNTGTPVQVYNRPTAFSSNGNYLGFTTLDAPLPGGSSWHEGYLVYYPEPEIVSVSNSVARGTSRSVTITGDGFEPGSIVFTSLDQIPDVSWSNIVVLNATTISATVTASSNATLGDRAVLVRTPDGGPGMNSAALGSCSNCLIVTP